MVTLRVVTLLIGVTLAGVSIFAAAHTEEYFDSKESAHGGQTRMAGPYHLELVAKDKEIVLYVMDHADQDLSTAGGAGKATVQIGKAKTKTSVRLEPAGSNMLKGIGDFTVTPETVVTVFVELPGQEATAARFVPHKSQAKLAMKNKDAKPQADDAGGHHHHTQH
ncbi:hypothetical protein [Nitrosovibrio tenuis]|uniref:Copper(I)-binding protein n=1 Tax=Nitrosovibrio tenuis TaxID=1233 RepID=A0A1H7QV46_9PROT|nr:hypothetical protein [Nitrosovibrio tenuis]SEL51187.1 hypothetical protein SAMN05216387_11344 [Nitrosovibrio tenuis]